MIGIYLGVDRSYLFVYDQVVEPRKSEWELSSARNIINQPETNENRVLGRLVFEIQFHIGSLNLTAIWPGLILVSWQPAMIDFHENTSFAGSLPQRARI